MSGRFENRIGDPEFLRLFDCVTTEQSLLGEGVFSAAFDEMNFYHVVERSKQMPEGGTYDQAQMLYNRISRRLKSRTNQRGRMPGYLFIIGFRFPAGIELLPMLTFSESERKP